MSKKSAIHRALVDSDFLIKLVKYDLFDPAIRALGLDYTSLTILGEAEWVASHQLRGDVRQRALSLIAKLSRLDIRTSDHIILEMLANRPDIDPGEILLIDAAFRDKDYLILTGDKRFLKALANDQQLAKFHERLRGRVVSLEQAILRLIVATEYNLVAEKIRHSGNVDKAIDRAFQNNLATDRLQELVEKLQQDSNGLLADH